MQSKRIIAIGLCVFLTIAPLLGTLLHDNKLGQYICNLTPYIHLTIPQVGGMPFADAFGALCALLILLLGIIGFVIFIITKFSKAKALRILLYITMLYCSLRFLGGTVFWIPFLFQSNPLESKFFILICLIADGTWFYVCFWAAKQLDVKV